MTFWRQNYMQHLRLDFKAGSAQNSTLGSCGQLKHQFCARSFWNIEITAPVARGLSPGPGRCPLTQNGVSPCTKVLAFLCTSSWAAARRQSLGRVPGATQQLAASRRKDSRTRVTHLLPRITLSPQTWAGSVPLWPSCWGESEMIPRDTPWGLLRKEIPPPALVSNSLNTNH